MTIYQRYKGETETTEADTTKAIERLSDHWKDVEQMLASGEVMQTPFTWYCTDKAKLEEIGN